MSFLFTIAAFILTLGVLIVVHEYGHYWVARLCGVKVLRFSVGFGRPLLRRVRGPDRTEWVVAAIPLGGYVRMLDERDTDGGPIPPADLPRAFNRQPVAKRVAIVLAGPVANLLLAIAVYWGLNVVGVMEPPARIAQPAGETPAARAGLQQGDVVIAVDRKPVRTWNELSWLILQGAVERRELELDVRRGGGDRQLALDLSRLTKAELEGNPLARIGLNLSAGPPRLGNIVENSPAARAGLVPDDRVMAVDGQAIGSARDLIDVIRASPERPLSFVVTRNGERDTIDVVPARVVDEKGVQIGRIGAEVGDQAELIRVRYGPLESVGLAVERTWDMIVFSLRMLGQMITGQASLKNLSGPVTIADYAGKTASLGIASYLSFLALVSISLGVLNLLPIPMLDGGHLLYYFIEILKGSPPADWLVEWGQRAGIVVLVMLTSLALFNDLSRLLS
jgi:regulator of sigma E protease